MKRRIQIALVTLIIYILIVMWIVQDAVLGVPERTFIAFAGVVLILLAACVPEDLIKDKTESK